ncbi:MAG TPA: Uma2 family endonuclease [Bacteroidetes bacterium]|nr:Uma2 family endonuclease [Bacteroidota bacterium]
MFEITAKDIVKQVNALKLVHDARKILQEEEERRRKFRDWANEDTMAEFINGEVVVHSPPRRRHKLICDNLYDLIRHFVRKNKLGETAKESDMIGLTRNDYLPDICFWNNEKSSAFDGDTVIYPAPDLAVEILSRSTASNDRKTKFKDYALHGIGEYWIIDPKRQIVEQYRLLTPKDTSYVPEGKFGLSDEITSFVLPDFTVPVLAIFDENANQETLKSFF